MTARALAWLVALSVTAAAASAIAQGRAAPPPGLLDQARVVARDQLHLFIDTATGSVHASTLGEVRRDRASGGRYAFFPRQAELGTLDGAERARVWVVHLSRPATAGTEGAVVVFDTRGQVLAAWELFSPD
jgi:hypothetical protein